MDTIRLIACDLDGTLLLDGAQSLNEDTCSLIHALKEKGILFFAASGRQYTNLQRLFAPIKDEIGYICENGCVSFYQGKMICQSFMDHALGLEIIEAIKSEEGAEVLLSGLKTSYLQPKSPWFGHHISKVVKNDVTIVPDITKTTEPYMKISLCEKGGLQDKEKWEERFQDRCTVVTGGNIWLDFMPKGVNKATALEKVLAYLGIDRKECMAIGDNDNDREMLASAGFPVAMKSAKKEIRALSAYETATVEELLAALAL